ncbi:MAG: CPBP family intramembrane metalloprotease [Candidatus Lokiarchaeota archaeon]|nr:CPBP family intramembrane metalloprotease [Candidatus Lokiarchaeota archaeon]
MKNKFIEYYSMAKFISHEVFYEAQMKQAGSRQASFLEKCEKNKKYIGNMVVLLKIISSFMIVLLPLIYLVSGPNVLDLLVPNSNMEITVITYGIIFSILMTSYLSYLVLFGLYTMGAYMSGESFYWLRTLPISKPKLRKYAFMTLFRSIDLQLISLCLAIPIMMFIFTHNLVLTFLSFLISIPNAIFCLCFLIFIGERVSRVIFNPETTSKKSTRMKILVFSVIIGLSIGMNITLQLVFFTLEGTLAYFSLSPYTNIWNLILSLIPYPFAPIYFISLFISPTNTSLSLWATSTIGFLLFLGITYLMSRKALKSLSAVIGGRKEKKYKRKIEDLNIEEIKIEVAKYGPIKAYIKKDLTTAARDPQSAMLLIMPMIMTIIMIISFSSGLTEVSDLNIQLLSFLMVSLLIISTMNPLMLVMGLMNMEESGFAITSSLPILPRDQAKAKLILMIIIQSISFIVSTIFASIIIQSFWVVIVGLCALPISLGFLFIAFMMKIMLFGKMKYKYITEEIYKEKKIRKWLLIGLMNLGLVFLNFTIIMVLASIYMEVWFLASAMLLIGGIILCVLFVAFDKMFPSFKGYKSYITGGSLRKNPIFGAIAVLLLYWCLPFIVLNLIYLTISLFINPIIDPIGFNNIRRIVGPITEFSVLALIFIIIVPKWLSLPYGSKKLNQYLKDIKITNKQNYIKNILIGIISFLIIVFSLYMGSLIFGNYTFSFDRIFHILDTVYFGLGAFIFLYMLIPAIWEEIAFRGINTSIFKEKYNTINTIIMCGLLFGLSHLINFLTLIGESPLSTVEQIIYASFMGITLSYTYFKTRSLIPCIIIHYCFNVFGTLFIPIVFDSTLLEGIYSIIFIGIIPMILIILFVYTTQNSQILKRE